jgi:hypothetical protein
LTGQTWQDYNAELLKMRDLNLMSTVEYQMASHSHSCVELLLMCVRMHDCDYGISMQAYSSSICMHDYDYGICMQIYYSCICMHYYKLCFGVILTCA